MIPYHADGELCAFFPINDVNAILEMATQHKTFHITYCNSLRNYVKSLENLQDIGAVYYGMEVPDEFKSDVYKFTKTFSSKLRLRCFLAMMISFNHYNVCRRITKIVNIISLLLMEGGEEKLITTGKVDMDEQVEILEFN